VARYAATGNSNIEQQQVLLVDRGCETTTEGGEFSGDEGELEVREMAAAGDQSRTGSTR
jgi:hypothetical protein